MNSDRPSVELIASAGRYPPMEIQMHTPLSAAQLLERHFETLFTDGAAWQELIEDGLIWELPYAPSIGHPAVLEGRDQVTLFLAEFKDTLETWRFFDVKVSALAGGTGAVGEVRAEARIRTTGKDYHQRYVVFLESRDGKIASLREYFNPLVGAKAFGITDF
jgi:ketosteroid isomerase-like protein